MIRWRTAAIVIGVVCTVRAADVAAQGGAPSTTVATTPRPTVDARTIDEVLARRVTVRLSHVSLLSAIDTIAARTNLFVQYRRQTIQAYDAPISVRATDLPLREVFSQVLAGTPLHVIVNSKDQIMIVGDPAADSTQTVGTIMGRVVDSASGRGLVGATVTIPGTTVSVMTGGQGVFKIARLPGGIVRVHVRMLGYSAYSDTVRVASSGVTSFTVVLARRASVLADVVTTATQSQLRAEVPVEVSRLNVDSLIANTPVRSITDLLASRIPGVQVTRGSGDVGAPVRIRIGGLSSASLTNDPIVILDGVRIAGPNTSASRMQRMSSPLDDIDPKSLATIEVLHGPAATTLYGTDAANGVIIMTSKYGVGGTTRWTAGVTYDWSSVPEKYPPIYQGWGHTVGSSVQQKCTLDLVSYGMCILDSVSTTNPLNNSFTTNRGYGSVAQYSVGVSGGVSLATYSLTASRSEASNPERMIRADEVRARLDNLPVSSAFTDPNGQTTTTLSTALSLQPASTLSLGLTANVQRQPQRQNSMASSGLTPTDTISATPHQFAQTTATEAIMSTAGGLTAHWHLLPQLTVNGTAGMQRVTNESNTTSLQFQCQLRAGCVQNGPATSVLTSNGSTEMYTASGNASWQVALGRLWASTTSIVGSYHRTNVADMRLTAGNFPVGATDISSASFLIASNNTTRSATAGMGVEELLAFRTRMFFTLGLRRDAGSAFGGHVQSPMYPQLGMSWMISEEPFFPTFGGVLSDLQLRVAYGQSGVQPDPTMTFPTYARSYPIVNGQPVLGIVYSSVGNSVLQPERSEQTEVGMTATLWTNRITLDMTASNKRSQNAIVTRVLAPSVPFGSQSQNIGAVLNRTFDLTATVVPIDIRDLRWTIVTTANALRNKVLSLGNATLTSNYSSAVRIIPGYPLFGTWIIPVLGVHANGSGLVLPEDIVTGDTSVYVGYSQPRQSFNYNTTIALPRTGLSLNAALSYAGPTMILQSMYDGYGRNDPKAPPIEQALGYLQTITYNANWQSASVLRFNSLQLNWALPPRLAARFHAQSATLSLAGTNLGQWTKYRGADPSVNSLLTTAYPPDINVDDGNTMPTPRAWSMGLQLGF